MSLINKENKSPPTPHLPTSPELMAPAGDWTMLSTAINAGANAVYFGLKKFNMRAKAENFSIEELPAIVNLCKEKNVKTYLTLNTIIFEDELEETRKLIRSAVKEGIDRIICWDLAVAEICKDEGIPFCISTQASVSNSVSVNFYKKAGAARVVLARECSLEQIKEIKKKVDIEIEAFIHGAMCIAVSGRCFLSHHIFGKSANRGECLQPCRREYEITDPILGKSVLIGEDYVLSPTDLCTIEFVDQLIEAGIDSFKIEGRKRSPEYVAKTVSIYRQAIDLYYNQKLNQDKKKEFLEELKSVYNRGFSTGFYFNVPTSEEYAGTDGNKATKIKKYSGKVLNYYKKAKAVYVQVDAGELLVGDEILITGPTTGVLNLTIQNIVREEETLSQAAKGDKITIPCNELVRPRDKIYRVINLNPKNPSESYE
jgi:putative protease